MRKDEMMITAIGSTGLRPALDALKNGASARAAAAKALAGGETKAAAPTAVAEMVAGGAPIDTDKVASIKAALAAGTYKIDPQAIANRMIAADLPAA